MAGWRSALLFYFVTRCRKGKLFNNKQNNLQLILCAFGQEWSKSELQCSPSASVRLLPAEIDAMAHICSLFVFVSQTLQFQLAWRDGYFSPGHSVDLVFQVWNGRTVATHGDLFPSTTVLQRKKRLGHVSDCFLWFLFMHKYLKSISYAQGLSIDCWTMIYHSRTKPRHAAADIVMRITAVISEPRLTYPQFWLKDIPLILSGWARFGPPVQSVLMHFIKIMKPWFWLEYVSQKEDFWRDSIIPWSP